MCYKFTIQLYIKFSGHFQVPTRFLYLRIIIL